MLTKDLDLEGTIQVVKGMEQASKWLKEMDTSSKVETKIGNIGKESTPIRVVQKTFLKDSTKKGAKGVKKNVVDYDGKKDIVTREIKCFHCGAPGHIATSFKCGARGVVCRNCGKKGHFSKMCRLRYKQSSVKEVNEICEGVTEIILPIYDEKCGGSNDIKHVKKFNGARKESDGKLEKSHCIVSLDELQVKMLVDSGSMYALVSKDTLSKKLYDDWSEPDIKAVGYGGK